jgi:light-regulated signal transduction histidine kinase (bacteriophytochrome)
VADAMIEAEKSLIDMTQLVHSVVHNIRRLEPHRSVAITMHPLTPIWGDSTMLQQVFANLLANAWKFSQYQPQACVEIGCYHEHQECIYYVKDNGAGFDMQYVDKLFGVFQRLHSADVFEGTGVGLAIVQRVILRHGGRVWAQGQVNAGATFYVALPTGRA